MDLGYYLNIIICEYLYDEELCISFLHVNNENIKNYEHIYMTYNSVQNIYIRKLCCAYDINQIKECNFLLSLTFDNNFNQEIKENILPKSLTSLTFGHDFNQEIKENTLPKSLTNLKFGCYFNQKIKENILPKSLISLTFGYCFDQEIKNNVLPTQLIRLYLYENYKFKNNIKIMYPNVNIIFYE